MITWLTSNQSRKVATKQAAYTRLQVTVGDIIYSSCAEYQDGDQEPEEVIT